MMYTPLTSPQQTSQSMLTSYQTPPQPQQHQLYISATSSGESTGPNSSSTTATTSSSGKFRMIDLYSNWAPPGVNGTDNTSARNIVIVAPNNWDRKNTTAI